MAVCQWGQSQNSRSGLFGRTSSWWNIPAGHVCTLFLCFWQGPKLPLISGLEMVVYVWDQIGCSGSDLKWQGFRQNSNPSRQTWKLEFHSCYREYLELMDKAIVPLHEVYLFPFPNLSSPFVINRWAPELIGHKMFILKGYRTKKKNLGGRAVSQLCAGWRNIERQTWRNNITKGTRQMYDCYLVTTRVSPILYYY